MGKRIDLTGQRFGRLVVISKDEEVSKQKKVAYWNCICDCGNITKPIRGDSLRNGNTQSCGCLQKEKAKQKWEDEEFRQMKSNKMREKWEDEEFRSKQSNKMKHKWKDEEFKQRQSELSSKRLKEQWKDEEFRQARSNDMKKINIKRWQDEEYRQAKSDKIREMWQDEEFRKMQSEQRARMNYEMWQDEEMKWKLNYKGGITPISTYLRSLPIVKQWRENAYKHVNYKCQLTGKKVHGGNSDVHHLYGLNMIVLDAHNTYNIEVKPHVKDYTEEELRLLEDYITEWHKDTSNAVVLSKEVHALFHQEYGYGGNTPEQYEEFKKSYKNRF